MERQLLLVSLLVTLCFDLLVFPSNAETRRNPKDGQIYVRAPAGTFQMGCSDGDKECYEDERPVHTVQIGNDFWIGQTEVTVAAFQRFSDAKGVAMPPAQKGSRYPVMSVIWDEANAFCKWAGDCQPKLNGNMPREAVQRQCDTAISTRLHGRERTAEPPFMK
jgi:formylglycine-generating enzyme required for sulfatase activity